ncbi:MAG: hypothetical protein ACQEUZ_16440 [Pseudomonadota bacterium]
MLRTLLRAIDSLPADGAEVGTAPDLRAHLLSQTVHGGWRGGDARMRAEAAPGRVEAGVLQGRARLWLDGEEARPFEIVYAPWGFRMMVGSLTEGVSYAVGLAPPSGPPRLSVMAYGPGLTQFGPRQLVLGEALAP